MNSTRIRKKALRPPFGEDEIENLLREKSMSAEEIRIEGKRSKSHVNTKLANLCKEIRITVAYETDLPNGARVPYYRLTTAEEKAAGIAVHPESPATKKLAKRGQARQAPAAGSRKPLVLARDPLVAALYGGASMIITTPFPDSHRRLFVQPD